MSGTITTRDPCCNRPALAGTGWAHLPNNSNELLCVRTTSEVCLFHSLCAELTGVTGPFHARDALELLESTTKFRRKRAPVAELESSANPQPGKAALRSARFPACGFWRLSSRQRVVLFEMRPFLRQGGFKIGARTAMSAHSWLQIKFARTRLSALLSRRFLNPPCSEPPRGEGETFAPRRRIKPACWFATGSTAVPSPTGRCIENSLSQH